MNSQLSFMEKLAREAGRIQIVRLGQVHKLEYKSPIDLVTEVDRECEALIVSEIQKKFPGDDIMAEEGSGASATEPPADPRRKSGARWHVDPLDGTVNYAHGFPFFCVSIGLEVDGKVDAGVIYDPNRDELFAAERGKGATLNGKPIHVSKSKALKQSLLATGFACLVYKTEDEEVEDNLAHFGNFIRSARAVRRPGSAATDLAWTACGRIDGFWELSLKPWDMAAGSLIIQEAGGAVTSFDGGAFDLYGTEILASNGRIHGEMISVLKT